jgi:hypothetical protein
VTATGYGALKGALLIDTANGVLYINLGTPAAPDWQNFVPSEVVSAAELAVLDAVVAGTAAASKAVVLGADKELDEVHAEKLYLGDGAGTEMTKTAAEINLLAAGVAGGYKLARGVAPITGTGTVATGLATVVAVIATAQDDLDGDALAGVSATIGDQAGNPAAGSVIIKAWKNNADGDATMVAATAEKNINWVAVGT